MNTRNKIAQATRHHLATLSAVGSLLLGSAVLVACGGGGGGVSGGGTGALATNFSAGAVTGKGSTIVNGVRFDDSGIEHAGIDDANDDNSSTQANHVSDDVKVGMEVEIEHGSVTCPTPGLTVATCDVTPTAVASKITFGGNSVVGPVTAVSTTGGVTTITLFGTPGQTVLTNAATVVNLQGQAALAVSQVIEVHGSLDATSKTTTASLIEVKAATAAAFTGSFRIRGLLDVKASTIGGTPLDLNGASTTSLDGTLVRAKLDTSATPKVLTLKSAVRKLDDHKGASAEIEGSAEAVTVGSNGDVSFTINGAAVRVTSTTALLPVTAKLTDIVKGVHVEAEGTVDATSGVLQASKLKFKKAEDEGAQEVELHGAISNYDAKAGTFKLRGQTVTIDANTFTGSVKGDSKNRLSTLAAFEAAVLITSNKFEVKGTRVAGGTQVLASLIKLDN
jgi:hypothetical protein